MNLKRCDKCGTSKALYDLFGFFETIHIDYIDFHYCNSCIIEIKIILKDFQKVAYKIVAKSLEQP